VPREENDGMTRQFKVLIADDERPVASGLQGQLESLGYEVVAVASDGQRAIDLCRRTLPDVVLMDIEMPGMDGLTAARQISQDPGTPIVILSAHGHPNLVEQAILGGVVQYLMKPVTSPALHAALQTAIAQSDKLRLERERAESERMRAEELEATLRERKLIERAKGILMTRKNLTEPEAFRFLQRQSQDKRMPMAKLAESIVQADELFEPPSGSGTY
jgi:response regulator NasT